MHKPTQTSLFAVDPWCTVVVHTVKIWHSGTLPLRMLSMLGTLRVITMTTPPLHPLITLLLSSGRAQLSSGVHIRLVIKETTSFVLTTQQVMSLAMVSRTSFPVKLSSLYFYLVWLQIKSFDVINICSISNAGRDAHIVGMPNSGIDENQSLDHF